jgi:hypothetical protein
MALSTDTDETKHMNVTQNHNQQQRWTIKIILLDFITCSLPTNLTNLSHL